MTSWASGLGKDSKFIMKVIKPWGYEYLAYDNDDVGVWILHIDEGESTSMHCHPKKDTGLIVLEGEVEISFLNNTYLKKDFDKTMLRKGLFHSSKAVNGNAVLLEVESPKDKEDLVRLYDSYGRRFKPYEDNKEEGAGLSLHEDAQGYRKKFYLRKVTSRDEVSEAKLFVFVGGGLSYKGDMIVKAGDVLDYKTLNTLLDNFDLIEMEYIAIC